ncbi:MAG TPA: glycoside hydrolase family 15 protein [Kofleriaceae bacterium]|jgi:hypothetical protein|nr:glycoside hydrolase family 15 protein [Kofleriaceae bacterium]
MLRRVVPALALVAAIASPAGAVDPVPSFQYLVTGNGFGFQVFDASANAIKQYLEHPYRYLHANPTDPDAEGVIRRNLAYDTYFGIRVGSSQTWLESVAPGQTGYVNQTNVIRSEFPYSGVDTESFFVAPYGYAGNAMVMMLKVTNTSASPIAVTAYSIHNFHMGTATNPDTPGADGESINYDGTNATETGPGGGVMIYTPIGGADVSNCGTTNFATVQGGGMLTAATSCSGTDQVQAYQKSLGTIQPGAVAWWGVAVLFDGSGNPATAEAAWTTFLAGRTADKLYADVLSEWDSYRTPPPMGLSDTETATWRQAEAVLRMGQILEPYADSPRAKNYGMMLASLPPGEWHTGWVRDGTYATVALARTGHYQQAKDSLNFFLNADADEYGSYLANVNYQISVVRYFGDGLEESDFSGQPTRNIEIDGWGLYMWAARQYLDASGDTAWLTSTTAKGTTVYDEIKNGVAEPLAANLETSGIPVADTSIWEVHWANRQHWLYTTAAAARGFCDMASLALNAGQMDDVTRYQGIAQKMMAAIPAAFGDHEQVLAGSVEELAGGTNYHDGSTVESITFSDLDPSSATSSSTLNGLSYLVTPAGGYKRLEGSTDEYDTDEWILIDLRASDAFRRNGNTAKADQLLDWVTSQAGVNYNLLPELYNTVSSSGTIGAYTGSIPMVGYGAGAYEMTLLDRAGAYEHTDCGQYTTANEPDAGVGGGGGGGGGGGSDVADGRSGIACACNGGPGSGPTAVLIAIAGVIVLRKRRR